MARPLIIVLVLMLGVTGAFANEAATPQEVIAKVKEAAAYLEKNGKSGLKAFDSADSPFVWKDTYVFVFNCAADRGDVAHPASTAKEHQSQDGKIATGKDATGRVGVGPEACKAAVRPGGGWIEYMWWQPVKVESFNARLRDELLNGELFYTLTEARIIIESWRRHYNNVRPHSSLGYKPPAPEVFVPSHAARPSPHVKAAPTTPLALALRPTLHEHSTWTTRWGRSLLLA